MPRVIIDYSDGEYGMRLLEDALSSQWRDPEMKKAADKYARACSVEVTYEMWRQWNAFRDLAREWNELLGRIDSETYEAREEAGRVFQKERP